MDWMIRIYPSSTKPSTLEIGGISTFRGPYSTTSQGLENIDPATEVEHVFNRRPDPLLPGEVASVLSNVRDRVAVHRSA
jgi:hypothetical protein